MTHGRGKSDPAIVAVKSTNKTGQPVAELVERRAGAEGNVDQQSTPRTQIRKRVTQALDRVRQAARQRKKERFTALPPRQHRITKEGVLRAEAQGRSRCRWYDVAGVRGRSRGKT